MMYTRELTRYKWKRKTLVILYLVFILAHLGEIFLNLEHIKEAKNHQVEVKESLKIPIHLPHEAKIEFIKIEKLQRLKEF